VVDGTATVPTLTGSLTLHVRIEANRLIPGRGEIVFDGVVVLDGPTILYAGPEDGAPQSPGAQVVTGDTVMPGMWDAHTHLVGLLTAELSGLYRQSMPLRAARATADLGRTLRAGFTSVREAGGMGVELKQAVAEGSVPGPRIYAAGSILSPTGGHADLHELHLDWFHELSRWEGTLRVCDGVPSCMTAVREQLRRGADVIKVCASGGVLSELDHPVHQQFTATELAAIVEVAGLAERPVMAHCHGKPGMMAAIEAGVHTIEHGTYLDEEVCAAMVERDVMLVPTRLIVTELMEVGLAAGMSPAVFTKLAATAEHHAAATALAHAAGVRIALGTDVALSRPDLPAAWGNNARELPLLAEVGLKPLEILEAATANGPDTLGARAPRSGQLIEGYDADVLLVDGDPTADVGVLVDAANISHVWQAGTLVSGPR
jgi:imidazolonepropionase-like amidohydrolase